MAAPPDLRGGVVLLVDSGPLPIIDAGVMRAEER